MSSTVAFSTIAPEVLRRYHGVKPLLIETSASSGGGAGTLHIPSKGYSSWPASKFNGCKVYAVGVTAPNESMVTAGGYSASTGIAIFDIEPDMGATPNSSKVIWFMYGLDRDAILRSVNTVVQNTYAPALLPYPNLVTDGDMEVTGMGNWTSVGSPGTSEKVTTAARVFLGKQAAHVITDTLGEGIRSDAIDVYPGETLIVSFAVMSDVANCKVELYDVTNSAVLRDVNLIDFEGYAFGYFDYTISGSTEQVYVRFLNDDTAISEFYVGMAQVLSTQRKVYTLPSTFDNSRHLRELFYMDGLQGTDIADTYIPWSGSEHLFPRSPSDWRDYQGANSNKIALAECPHRPLFARLLREDAALSLDADTTTLPLAVVAEGAVADLYQKMAKQFNANPRLKREYEAESASHFRTYRALAAQEGLLKEHPDIVMRPPIVGRT